MHARLAAIATASPSHLIDRSAAEEVGRHLFGADLERLGPVHANAGIDRRAACVSVEWLTRPHGWAERSRLFADHSVALGRQAGLACLDRAGRRSREVDAVVAVSTTGVATPSLDALLIEPLGLRPDVLRLPIFGLGCAGGALGLARAAALAKAMPGAHVLLVVVELCTLTFRPEDRSPANVVATALFGDGAAAALLSTDADGPAISAWGEHTWPDSLDIMGWRITDDGFGVLFSRDIPSLVARELRPVAERWLAGLGLARRDVGAWACHPGGAKVVAALEETLALPPGSLDVERAVLRDHGNMSAATLLYVLERRLARPLPARMAALALGPGFTAGFVMLEAP